VTCRGKDTCSKRLTVEKYTCGGYSEEEPCTRRHLADAQAIDTGASVNSAGGTQGFREEGYLRKYRTYPVRGVEWRASETPNSSHVSLKKTVHGRRLAPLGDCKIWRMC
jgi:hypothetical protein